MLSDVQSFSPNVFAMILPSRSMNKVSWGPQTLYALATDLFLSMRMGTEMLNLFLSRLDERLSVEVHFPSSSGTRRLYQGVHLVVQQVGDVLDGDVGRWVRGENVRIGRVMPLLD
jgi:hypothetical protein